jgi:hypothetical protein
LTVRMTGDEISPSKDFLQKQNGRFLARECPLYDEIIDPGMSHVSNARLKRDARPRSGAAGQQAWTGNSLLDTRSD